MLDDASLATARARASENVGSTRVTNLKRVVLLGAESTGKSTLAAALAHDYGTVWNPEYGRPYTQLGRERGAAWTSDEFTHIARIHCWYEDFLAELARDVLFVDTDAFTTAVFHEVYLDRPTTAFADLVDRPYDLFVVCGLDVPWRHDGIREFDKQRRAMHERYVARAADSGSPWQIVEGSLERRLATAAAAVDAVLAGNSDGV
jgi:NadR type nicotinamide-nucleotide adenylyltransferase